MKSTLTRYKTLSKDELDLIDTLTKEEYQMILNVAATF